MSSTPQERNAPMGTFGAEDLPSRPAKSLVVPMDSISVAPVEDQDMVAMFPNIKSRYEEITAYVNHDKQAKIDECNALMNRVHNVEASLTFVPPGAAMDLMAIIQEHQVDTMAKSML